MALGPLETGGTHRDQRVRTSVGPISESEPISIVSLDHLGCVKHKHFLRRIFLNRLLLGLVRGKC